MQVLKKLNAAFLVLAFSACQPVSHNEITLKGGTYGRHGAAETSGSSFFDSGDNFKVAMLIPLSGKASAYGQGLKNAAMMALEDTNNPHLVVQFYDTQSSPAGARNAAQQALDNGSRLILGPLTGEEVSAIASPAQSADVPVISFSTSPNVLQDGVYTLGLLGSEQIERVIGYASSKGRNRIAVLVPDNPAGMNMAKAAVSSASRHGAQVVKIGFYPPQTMDFSEIVKSLTDYSARSSEINQRKNALSAKAKAGDAAAARELKKLKTVYTTGDIDFDAVLIPETGSRLKSAAAMFGYYDVAYPDVLFMGTSVWENTNLNKETTLYHGVYPVISRVHNNYFNGKYQSLFGEQPNPLYSFAYDGVALSASLARKNSGSLEENITDSDGYIGINGAFRIFDDGNNQHSLDIVEVTPEGPTVVDAAAKKFDIFSAGYYTADSLQPLPKIYGKDPDLVKMQIFSQPKPQNNSFWY